ncbi:MAG TPA: LytR C-terminal domain-containing protein [Gaiellaceae bacterium]|nr:LytR C-terminal domain-containing protein [Gaiellaceae bacterium]
MQHAQQIPTGTPWRTATFVVGAVAAAELAALLIVGGIRLAPSHHERTAAAPTPVTEHAAVETPRAPSHPLRPRDRVRVLVLNGNGVSGAAATQAQRLELAGYRVGGTENAPRHDYAQSIVMYVPGWAKEAQRLARDAGVRLVSPIDGLRPAGLKGSKIVLLLGS